MKKKHNQIVLFLLLCILFLSSCSNTSDPINQTTTGTVEEKSTMSVSPYLSITYTEYVNGKNTDNGMVIRSMIYDLITKETKTLANIPYTSQTPLSVISKAENKVYYSAGEGNKGDQLFSYDLTSHKEEKLTNNLFAINYIVPTSFKGELVLAAVKKNEGNLKTIFLSKQMNSLNFLHDTDTDTNTWCLTYNDKNKSIYTAEYSEKAQFEARELAGKKQKPTVPPDYIINEINTETLKEREVIRLQNEQVISLASSDDQLFVVTSRYYNRGENEYNFVNIQTGKRTKLKLPIIAASSTAITQDDSELYYLGGPSGIDKRGIYVFDFKSQKSVPIFIQGDGFINEFSLIQ
ncbi:hypothetical protein GRF59_22295 [Paenibacillus sp. HJL G12]|uniref:Lipoprotein n=1 Tax=Paenibacillus dendrobii TaxID=2691084 RepID=A0A7X3ILU3_9BACL|nr:hypothetical protein [Paenibacillus dendrobii]MWV46338.1 hypothetical protein [Paenibacillus dendrobii]